MRKFHPIRMTTSLGMRARWGIARRIDNWLDGTLDLVLVQGEDHYSILSAKTRAEELEALKEEN